MEICTDGKTHVVADDDGGRLIVVRDGVTIATTPAPVSWKSALAVDFDAGLVYAGNPLVVYQLDTLARVQTTDLPSRRVVVLADGRIALVVGKNGEEHRLVVGRLGAPWELDLPLTFPEGQECGGITSEEPDQRAVLYDPRLTANAFGLAVSDGQTGVVARLPPGGDEFDFILHFNAAGETELFADAMRGGLVTVSRWAGREARVGRVFPGWPPIPDVPDGYGSRAHVLGTKHFLVYDNDQAILFLLEDGERVASVPVNGFIQASAVGPDCGVFATSDVLHLVRWDGAALTCTQIVLVERTRVSARFAEALPRERMRGKGLTSGRSIDGVWTYTIGKLDAKDTAAVEAARATLAELGGTDVVVEPEEA